MSRRLTRLTITSAFLLLAALMLAGPALAIHNTGKFQLDGNTGGTSSGLPDDWDNVYRSVTGKGAAHPSSALVQQFTTDSGEPDYSTFGPGTKDFQRVSQWTCNSDNNPQGKTNVLSAFAAVYNVSGHLDLFFGADRESNSGDANFGFWLFQSPVSCVPADKGGTGHFSGHKTHGDIFLVSEFTSGGTISKVKVYKWTDPDGIPENGDECLGDGVDCSSAHFGQAHPFATGVDCQSSNPHASNPNICATVNTAGYKSAWRTCTAARELFEGGIDLTALLGANATCFASFMAEARASQQFDADLKDYVIGELGTCGEITIRKKALGGDDHFDFDVMTGSLTPHPFTLQNGSAQSFSAVKAGAYAVKELAVPAGWQLTDIKCATSGGDTSATPNVGASTVNIAMGLAGTVDCTFTNSRFPTLTVIKKVVNNYGGTLTTSDFTLKVDGATVTSGVGTALPAGTHTVSEGSLPAGYVQVGITGDCDAYGKVTLNPGDTKTCTITNKDIAPQLKVIKHVVNDDGGAKTAADFTIQVAGTGVSSPSFPGSETGTIVSLKAGAYGVDEVAVAGYARSLSADCAGTIAVGVIKTCTVTNDDVVTTLVVIKKVNNTHGGTKTPADFTLTVTGTSPSLTSFPGADAPGTTVTIKPGAYSVDEVAVAGYAKSLSADCAGTIAAGQTRTCTVTNSDIAPQLTVIKHVVNDDGGTAVAGSFTLQVTGTSVSTPSFPGAEAGTTVTLSAGAYSVDEVAVAGYAKSLSADCAGTIVPGQTKTCTVTNDDIAPKLTVIKKVSNTHGGTKAPGDFTLTVTGNAPSPASFPGADSPGTTVTIKAGSYSVDEVAAAGYAKSLSADCAGTIAAGQTKTCTVTNSDIAPKLTVIKHVINDNGGTALAGSFTMQVAGASVSTPSFPGSEAGTSVTLNTGSYNVDELPVVGYAKSLSGDCAGTIALGESKTCTITNDDVAPRLTVIKHVVNDNGGTAAARSFTMQVTGAGVSTPSFPGSEAGTTVTLDAGAYGVDELPAPGYARTIGADCAGTIALGETKTCAITNDDIAPRLVVVKNVINDNGGGATPASFTMTVTGNTPSPASFPGAGGAGTTVALKAGAYSVSESGPSGYAGTFSADCSGTISLGQTRTCVVTNDDIPPALIVIKHVVNSHGGSAVAAQFTMIVTGTNISAPSFAGSEAGTTVTLNAGPYSVDEISAAGYLKTLSADCAGSIALGETRTCLVTNNDPPPFPRLPFCDEPTVLAVLDPASGRFPNNRGPDVIVDARTGSIQAAINAASDTNGDGLIIIGVVAKDNLQAGGVVDQSIDLSKAYGKPFALVACGVLLHDPMRCDGIAAVSVHASATSPEYPVGSGVTLYIHGLSSQYSQSSPGFMVEGNGRYIEGASVTDSMIGVKIVGNRNTVHNGYMHGNLVSGVVVEGNGNVIDTVQSVDNAGGDGIQVTGSGNTVVRSTAGGQGAGNGGNGITVSGPSNLIASNSAFANTGDGINVGGGTAANPNIVRANIAGTPYRGNGGNGIVVAGTGSGASSPIEIESNTTQSNGLTGVKVTGTGHQLKKNVSGGFKAKTNGLCEFEVGAGNINATGNTSGIKSILGADGSAFPTGCK